MDDRAEQARGFAAAAGWADADTTVVAGDASNRRYLRLRRADGQSAILMDAPRDRGEDVTPFINVAGHLAGLRLSAPEILAADPEHGFLLLEDLGDDLFARVMAADPGTEEPLYRAATDLLAELHRTAPPGDLPRYDPETMARLSALAFEWYLAGAGAPDPVARDAFTGRFRTCLERHAGDADVIILRDYHAENLLWLPGRAGLRRVGLLDFQDAMRGHRAYDLVSLLQDARRDVSPRLEAAMKARFQAASGLPPEAFEAAYHCLGAQRNLRIIGVFARLCLRDGKAHYIDLIPRVWAHLERDLAHPALAGIAGPLLERLPAPTPATLARLKSACATIPTA